ncbi:50S ribosomal protein L4 [Bacteroidales bacterium OttesenSCG-928-K03]|nr:50S ribosomal protein L4 [Odoribacter sp. OttesenSCG-928-L07]MDL2242748.1 50S ribosomal protein L4 [Bacteroidales bacterium OttesenSCG-928-K03]
MELVVYNIKGSETSRKVELNDEVFGIEANDHAIYLDAKQYMANQRQGTHKAKQKGEVSGSTKKLKKQKGTGTARAGSIKSPVFRGGGRVFGPVPRSYRFKLNKKVKALARRSALSYKVAEQKITIVEDFSFDTCKTKNFVELMQNFKLTDKRVLLVSQKADSNLQLSARNIQGAEVINADCLNTYTILKAHHMLVLESAISDIERICLK